MNATSRMSATEHIKKKKRKRKNNEETKKRKNIPTLNKKNSVHTCKKNLALRSTSHRSPVKSSVQTQNGSFSKSAKHCASFKQGLGSQGSSKTKHTP